MDIDVLISSGYYLQATLNERRNRGKTKFGSGNVSSHPIYLYEQISWRWLSCQTICWETWATFSFGNRWKHLVFLLELSQVPAIHIVFSGRFSMVLSGLTDCFAVGLFCSTKHLNQIIYWETLNLPLSIQIWKEREK